LDFPTWSWASTGGTKDWCLKYDIIGNIQCLSKSLEINDSRSLVTAGHITNSMASFQCVTPAMLDCCRILTVEHALVRGSADEGGRPAYLIQNDSTKEGIMGLAVFDGEPFPAAKCSIIALRRQVAYWDEADEIALRHDHNGDVQSGSSCLDLVADTRSGDPTVSAAIEQNTALIGRKFPTRELMKAMSSLWMRELYVVNEQTTPGPWLT
jgi:hypothetical protein